MIYKPEVCRAQTASRREEEVPRPGTSSENIFYTPGVTCGRSVHCILCGVQVHMDGTSWSPGDDGQFVGGGFIMSAVQQQAVRPTLRQNDGNSDECVLLVLLLKVVRRLFSFVVLE